MGRRHLSTHHHVAFKPNSADQCAASQTRSSSFAPPACFISALALGLVIGGGATAGAPGSCASSVAGVDLTCTGAVNNQAAFTATSAFAVHIGTTTPTVSTAEITRSTDAPGIKINAGNNGGSFTLTNGSSIQVQSGSGSNRHGLVISSTASGSNKTYTVNIDGTIKSADSSGDAVRLEGTNRSIFDVNFGRNANIGGGTGDDAVIVTGARSLLLKNYGILAGGSGQPTSGGEGINVGNGTRIASQGVTIENHGTITGTGNSGIAGGQGITVFGDGDVSIENGRRGEITGATQGIRVEADGDVTITNRGHIEGKSKSGVEVADGDTVKIKNSSSHTIEGATNGVYVHDVEDVNIDNDHGHIVGHNGDGVRIEDIDGDVSVQNRFGFSGWGVARITGSDDGVSITDVEGRASVDNRFGGKITGRNGDGVHVRDVDERITVDNSVFGSIRGREDGVNVRDAGDDVVIRNSFGGSISGRRGDGIDIRDVRDDVSISNTFGGKISGRDNGISVDDVRDNVSIDNRFGGSITGRRDDGVHARDVRGDVAVSNGAGGRITGGDDGVDIQDVRGDVTVSNAFGGSISGRRGDGVKVEDVREDVRIDNRFRGEIKGHDDGIHVEDVRDHVTVDNSFGGLIVGYRDDGIDIDDVRRDVEILNRFGGEISGRDNGIKVTDVDDDVSIDNRSGGKITGQRGDGLRIDDIDGYVSVKNSFGGKISGDDDGLHIANVEDGVRIDNRFGGSISGRDDDGIDVRDVDGGVRIDNRFGGRISGEDNGVKVHDVDGNIRISNSFGGKIRGDRDNGVDIDDVDGNVRIDNRFGGSISGRDDGVHADDVDGNVTIDNGSGSIRGRRGDGIDVSANGNVTVNNGRRGRITGADSAIQIDAQSAEINSAGLIRGSGNGDATIKLKTKDGATINNDRGGRIVGRHYDPTDLIVEAQGGAVTINNDGTMLGRIDLSGAGDTDWGNVFNNTSNHSWTFIGTSNLGNGLADVFNNTGTVFTTDPDAPENNDLTELAGVEVFNNGSLSTSGTIDLQDGFTGDVTTLTPTNGGSLVFNGETGHSYLKVDSFLGSSSNSSSDQLVINGDVSGRTLIDVNNVNPGFGSYNPLGIEVIRASGDISAQNFALLNGPIDTGLFDYNLYLNDSNEWVLASAPNRTFAELPSLVSAAQSMWHDASGVWLDRTADLRVAVQQPCVSEGLKGPAVTCAKPATSGAWIKGLGATESRTPEHSVSLLGTRNNYKTDYDQSGGGVVAGYDIVVRANDGQGIWLAGVMGGYLRSVVDFESSATRADFEGGAVGGYLTYLKGPWFLDAKLMANIGNVDYRGSFGEKDNAGITSIGGVLDTGYRVDRGQYFIEPGATLAYVNSDIDSLSIYGTSVNFANGDSLRGRLGVRLGTTVQDERAKYEPFVGVSAWYEFLGDNTANVASGGYVIQSTDSLTGAIGEVTGGVNVYSLADNGVSGFVKGNFEFGKDDYLGFGGSVGMRVAW
jgi:hypothetical protein